MVESGTGRINQDVTGVFVRRRRIRALSPEPYFFALFPIPVKTFTVYVIVGLRAAEIYVGQTNHLLCRYREHADGKVHSTKHLIPHIVAYVEHFSSRSEAMRREKELKQHKGRDWIRFTILPSIHPYFPEAQW